MMVRRRLAYALMVALVIILGLASRHFRAELPDILGTFAGDTLWATMVFLIMAMVWTRAATWQIAVAAAVFCLGIEASQLYHAPWIDALRANRLAALVLGFGFLWSDIACYAVGIALACGAERACTTMRRE